MSASRIPLYVMAVLSLLVALGTFRFLFLGLDLSFPPFGDHIASRPTAFVAHVTLSSIALGLGVVQFVPGLRARRPTLHRWTGRIYALCVLVGGAAGLLLAFHAPGGPIAGTGFALLALLWIAATGVAVACARQRQIARHRVWMIRSYALTFAGVTLRLYLAVFMLAGTDYVAASPWLAWMCWVPNLLIAEWWLRRGRGRAVRA